MTYDYSSGRASSKARRTSRFRITRLNNLLVQYLHSHMRIEMKANKHHTTTTKEKSFLSYGYEVDTGITACSSGKKSHISPCYGFWRIEVVHLQRLLTGKQTLQEHT